MAVGASVNDIIDIVSTGDGISFRSTTDASGDRFTLNNLGIGQATTPDALNVTGNVSIVGVTTVTGAMTIDRGSSSNNAIDINTTSTSSACRIRFNESGSNKAQIAYSHDNDRLELVASSGNSIAFYGGGNLTTRINTDGHLYPQTDSTYDLGLTGTCLLYTSDAADE